MKKKRFRWSNGINAVRPGAVDLLFTNYLDFFGSTWNFRKENPGKEMVPSMADSPPSFCLL